MSYFYDQTPGASSSKDMLDPQFSFTLDVGDVATAGWGQSCGGSLNVDYMPGQPVSTLFLTCYMLSTELKMCGSLQSQVGHGQYLDYTMPFATDAFEEALLRQQYAEFFDEDALPAAFSGSADEPWDSVEEEQRDSMIDIAPGKVHSGWTIPRAFGQDVQGELLQVCTPHLASFIRRSTHS